MREAGTAANPSVCDSSGPWRRARDHLSGGECPQGRASQGGFVQALSDRARLTESAITAKRQVCEPELRGVSSLPRMREVSPHNSPYSPIFWVLGVRGLFLKRNWRSLWEFDQVGRRTALWAIVAGVALSGCAGAPGPSLEAAQQAGADQPETDCGRLTGRVQIRILSLRNSAGLSKTTSLSRGVSSLTSTVGMSEGKVEAADARQARELSELHQMNARLKSLGCKSFDIDAALKDTSGSTPRPTL